MSVRLIVYPAKDLARTTAFFRKLLGIEPYVEGGYYVGFRTGDLEFGLDPRSESPGPIAYWDLADIRSSLQGLRETGAELHQDVRDVGRGMLIAQVKDPNGSVIGLRQAP